VSKAPKAAKPLSLMSFLQKQYSHTLLYPTEALLGFSPNLGQPSSKLSSFSLLRYALGAVGPVGLRVEARY